MRRGDVWLATLDPIRGSEQAGTRPVLILQTDPLNAFLRTVIVIPFTTNLQWARFPFCPLVSAGEGGLTSDSVALSHRLASPISPGCCGAWDRFPTPRWQRSNRRCR
jgi:mRNA interferase MazF